MLASSRHYLTAQLLSYFPSGDSRSGLGTNHYSLEPALLYYQRLSERFEIEGELGGWLPIGGSWDWVLRTVPRDLPETCSSTA